VTDKYAIEASHTYAGPVGTVWTARLTVTDTNTGESASKTYFVEMKDKNLDSEANVAIRRRLVVPAQDAVPDPCRLHGLRQLAIGRQCFLRLPWCYTNQPQCLRGQRPQGKRGGRQPLHRDRVEGDAIHLHTTRVRGHQRSDRPDQWPGTYNPDVNGNGFGIYNPRTRPIKPAVYLDAIVASGTPDAIAPTGPANVMGRKYKDIIQDFVTVSAFASTTARPTAALGIHPAMATLTTPFPSGWPSACWVRKTLVPRCRSMGERRSPRS